MADYIPRPTNLLDRLYQMLVEFYHSGNDYTLYLGNSLNKIMNGNIRSEVQRKTVMWGVMPEIISKKKKDVNSLAFVGVVRKSHGLDIAFRLLSQHDELSLKIFGECSEKLYKEYSNLIQKLGIRPRVVFENRFYTISELKNALSSCCAGLALYDTSCDVPIFYTDPGKVKTFTQFGLPVIMTRTSDIVPYIEKYTAGEVVDRNPGAVYDAFMKIQKSNSKYTEGVRQFNGYFDCETYYKRAFLFMELNA
jgi:glycosyltransferase involved in cell wall biosynthesis